MNVNTNMNMNNVLVTPAVPGGAINDQQISVNKNDFLKMLNMLMTENQNMSQPVSPEDTMLNSLNPGILMLMAGNNKVNRDIKDATYRAEDVVNNINNPETTKKSASDKMQADLYGMAYVVNPVTDSNNLNSLIAGINITPDVYSENLAYSIPEYTYLKPYAELQNTNQFQNTKQPDSENIQKATVLETKEAAESQIKGDTDVHNFSAEKLISQIEGNRNRLKNEIDFKANLLTAGNRAVGEQSITVSDEASELRPQIISQIADKIVLMAEEKPGAEGQIKYVTMELQPHDLGKVEIKMTFEGDKLTVEIKALNKETQKLLQSNAKELTDILNKGAKTAVDVIVKDNYNRYENHVVNNNHNNQHQEQHNYNQNHGEARQQERNKDGYSYHREDSHKDEEGIFSQMINLRNIKLST